jgi:hypothetical protein
MAEHIVKQFWPDAFYKATRQGEGFTVEDWFCMDGERYPVDFEGGRDWYQIDSPQDAPYYGQWTNPVTLQQLEYAEGDITLLQCETVEQYKAEMQRRQQFILQMAGDRDPSGYGLDDKDGRHWDKLEART